MDYDILLTVVLTLAAVIVLAVVRILIAYRGDFSRFTWMRGLLRRALRDPAFEAKLRDIDKPPPPPKPSAEPVLLLTVLQREGRLLDFLLENIDSYGDEQVGAAVRDIHRGCQKALQEHLDLKPVLGQAEGAEVVVPVGFDPSAIRLIGNVTGQPPFRGALRHHGWRVQKINLAKPAEGQDPFVVQPAEVELP